MSRGAPARDELAAEYLDLLPFEPYPVQQEALLAWFTAREGVLVCAPTGTGKTLIAEAAMYEALRTGQRAYYTTPLIALTEQKLQELQASAARWGFHPDDVGLVTGNRRVNPDAPILVVVAEILFNRLLHREAFDFTDVSAVVMDEFHSFNDPERGVVWELTLGLLPDHVRLLLLSATVGNAYEFTSWLRQCHGRSIELVESSERRVPLSYHWIGDELLADQIEQMALASDEAQRRVPALVFCFNRDQCWDVAETLKGKKLLAEGQQKRLAAELERYDLSRGAGPKLRQLLLRGVGVHHAGILPRYKRIVEDLFQRKLLSVTVCTETLAAGINLPARSVVLPGLLKGPPDKKRLVDPSAAHQMFGRAGRPQFDSEGHVYALAHEDDVRILRWRERYDQIPEDTKDPGLLQAKKKLKKKMPTRRAHQQYWSEAQFRKLIESPPGRLQSRGPLPWRLLAYLLQASPEVEPIRRLVGKRLMRSGQVERSQRELDAMLLTLARGGYVELEPQPPAAGEILSGKEAEEAGPAEISPAEKPQLTLGMGSGGGLGAKQPPATGLSPDQGARQASPDGPPAYRAELAHPTAELDKLLMFRGVNPLYGVFLAGHLGIADMAERLQAMESVLELPRSLGPAVRVPRLEDLPPGPLATTRLDAKLLQLGLATAEELTGDSQEPAERQGMFSGERVWAITLAEKLRRLFDYEFPGVHSVRTNPVWVAGELLSFGGDFDQYVTSHRLQKQEGVVFRHLLRLILLIAEFARVPPAEVSGAEWEAEMLEVRDRVADSCRAIDPASTDKTLEQAAQPPQALL